MNQDTFEGQWKQLRGQTQIWWGQLSDDDLQAVEGRMDKLVGFIQERYGYTRERAEQEVDQHFTEYDQQQRKVTAPLHKPGGATTQETA